MIKEHGDSLVIQGESITADWIEQVTGFKLELYSKSSQDTPYKCGLNEGAIEKYFVRELDNSYAVIIHSNGVCVYKYSDLRPVLDRIEGYLRAKLPKGLSYAKD